MDGPPRYRLHHGLSQGPPQPRHLGPAQQGQPRCFCLISSACNTTDQEESRQRRTVLTCPPEDFQNLCMFNYYVRLFSRSALVMGEAQKFSFADSEIIAWDNWRNQVHQGLNFSVRLTAG